MAEKKLKFKYIWDERMIDLGLRGNELLVYAVISSHSQNKQGVYYGNYDYLATVTGASIRAVKGVIERLAERGLIDKKCLHTEGAIIKNALSAASAEIAPDSECRNCTRASAESAPVASAEIALDTYYKDNNINTLSTEVDRDARARKQIQNFIKNYGCQESDLTAWFELRKRRKDSKKETKGNDILTDNEEKYFFEQVKAAGISVAEAVHTVAGSSWYGFKAEYINKNNKNYGQNRTEEIDRLHHAKAGAFKSVGNTCDWE